MLTLILIILVILTYLVLSRRYLDDFVLITGPLIVIGCIAWILLLMNIADGRVIDDKIAMYTEENAKIEASIDSLVSEYMAYESNTLINFKDSDSIALVSLYPELKSDELVKAQIETYQENNAVIKELKAKKLNISVSKWWIYFGR